MPTSDDSNTDRKEERDAGPPEQALSDGSSLVQTWTPAEIVGESRRLARIRAAFAALDRLSSDATTDSSALTTNETSEEAAVAICTRKRLNDCLVAVTDADQKLSVGEFNALMTGLEETGAADEHEARGATYADSEFAVDVPLAVRALDQWVVAATHADAHEHRRPQQPPVELTATLPPDAPPWLRDRVDRTDLELRHLAVQADAIVRLAAPYLDPEEPLLEDVAALPGQGIAVRLLTREVTGPSADSRQREAIQTLTAKVDPAATDALAIRDLYATDATGRQREAVHAKTVVVDEEQAYLGSANLTRLSLSNNFEMGVLLRGSIVEEVTAVFDAIFKYAETVSI